MSYCRTCDVELDMSEETYCQDCDVDSREHAAYWMGWRSGMRFLDALIKWGDAIRARHLEIRCSCGHTEDDHVAPGDVFRFHCFGGGYSDCYCEGWSR